MLGGFALAALVLAAVGIYGVVAYGVVQRTRELGIRMALGAGGGSLLRMVIRQGMAPVLGGIALGFAAALAGGRVLRGLLYGVGANDPVTFVAVTFFLVAVALAAIYLPARRAARSDPMAALRPSDRNASMDIAAPESPLRRPLAAEEPGAHRRRGAHARALHRRHDRDLQRGLRRALPAPAVSASRPDPAAADAGGGSSPARCRSATGPTSSASSGASATSCRPTARASTSPGADMPENVDGARVGADFFAMLGVQPALGRGFLPEEDAPGRGDAVLLSDGLWRRRFGADPSVVGREIRLDGRPHTVIGVMPAAMDYDDLRRGALAAGRVLPGAARRCTTSTILIVLARLNPGVTLAQAQAEMESLGRWLETNFPKENKDRSLAISSFMEELVGDYRPRLYVLLGAVGFVLLIACANIANLLLARGAARAREIAIRAAIGAGRGHLLRHALTESLVLAVGRRPARDPARLLGRRAPRGASARRTSRGSGTARVDGPVLAFAVGLTLLCGLVFGLAPALRMSRRMPHEALKEGGRSGSRPGAGTGSGARSWWPRSRWRWCC